MKLAIVLTLWLCALSLSACSSMQSLLHLDGKKAKKQTVAHAIQADTTTPLEIIFKKHPDLATELSHLSIQQVFNRTESPTAAQITVIQTGLLDDAVSAIRTVYQFKQQQQQWQLLSAEQSYQCRRGTHSQTFQSKPCV